MKYFIAGKEVHSDKKLEAGSLQNYSELGFECVYSHLLAKRYINSGILNKQEDVVVTCEGREFFYDKHIKTISWSEFDKIQKTQLTTSINASEFMVEAVLQETSYFHDTYMSGSKLFSEMYDSSLTHHQNIINYSSLGTPLYKFWKEDYELIVDLNYNERLEIPNEKYICLNRRHRKHREELNMPIDYTHKLIDELQNQFNVKIFITGFHNDEFTKKNNTTWVSLKDWCTLLNHNNCMAVIQNQTGTANLSQICGKENLLNIVLDMEMAHFKNILYKNGRRPDVLGKAVNFKNLRNVVFPQTVDIGKIIDNIKKYA